jgi:hypothetical protein
VILALAALLVGIGLAAILSGGDDGDTSPPTTAAPPATTAAPATEAPTTVAPTTAAPATTVAPTTTAPRPTTTVPRTTTTTEAPATTVPESAPGIGDTAEMAKGAVARLDAVTPDAPPLSDAFPPASGSAYTRVEIEECAGTARLVSNPIMWAVHLDDDTAVQATFGSGTYQTIGLAPGGCQRGLLEFEVPQGRTVADVVRSDDQFQDAATWKATGGGSAPSTPLASQTAPDSSPLGTKLSTPAGDATAISITPNATPNEPIFGPPEGSTFTRVAAELCGNGSPLVNPFFWLAQLQDNTLVPADVIASAFPPGQLDPGQCVQGTLDFPVPDGKTVAGVVYVGPDLSEVARWSS